MGVEDEGGRGVERDQNVVDIVEQIASLGAEQSGHEDFQHIQTEGQRVAEEEH